MAQDPRCINPDKLLEANKDYLERVEREGVYLVYDATLDTLFIEFGGPKEALSEHTLDNIMLRIAPDTLQIVGFEVLDFFYDFLPHNRLLQEWVNELGLRQDEDSRIALMEPRFKPYRDVIEKLLPHLAQSVGA